MKHAYSWLDEETYKRRMNYLGRVITLAGISVWWMLLGVFMLIGGVSLAPRITDLAAVNADWLPLVFLIWIFVTSIACFTKGAMAAWDTLQESPTAKGDAQ